MSHEQVTRRGLAGKIVGFPAPLTLFANILTSGHLSGRSRFATQTIVSLS